MNFEFDGRHFSAILTLNCVLMMHLAALGFAGYREVWIATATPIMIYSGTLVASWLAYRRSKRNSQQPIIPEVPNEPEVASDEADLRP